MVPGYPLGSRGAQPITTLLPYWNRSRSEEQVRTPVSSPRGDAGRVVGFRTEYDAVYNDGTVIRERMDDADGNDTLRAAKSQTVREWSSFDVPVPQRTTE